MQIVFNVKVKYDTAQFRGVNQPEFLRLDPRVVAALGKRR